MHSFNYNEMEDALEKVVLGKFTDSHDILHLAQIHAGYTSASYFNQKMYKAKNFTSDLGLLSHAMAIRNKNGLVIEFGVASGRTLNHLAALTSQKIYGFDSFQGLPEDWRTGFEKGAFAQGAPSVLSNVELIEGFFNDTLPDFLARQHETNSISLIHIDCDLYSSTKDVLTACGPFVKTGTVIVFDEYLNYPGWEQNEFRAFQEHVSTIGASYRYEAFVSRHQQVCVVME